jgi:hypothetical protein
MGGSSSKQKKQTGVTQGQYNTKKGVAHNKNNIGGPCNSKTEKQRPVCITGLICKPENRPDGNTGSCRQNGGNINYQEKYQKYKSKYLDLKEKNNL